MVASSTGCSYMLVDGPPPKKLWSAPKALKNSDCTESGVLPIVDGIYGGRHYGFCIRWPRRWLSSWG
jgi:hypothetical protein